VSSKRRARRAACPCGKVRYRDELGARVALSTARESGARGNERRREQRVYRCNICRGWHLTAQDLRPATV
jgi:hypothetical protein